VTGESLSFRPGHEILRSGPGWIDAEPILVAAGQDIAVDGATKRVTQALLTISPRGSLVHVRYE
jgi:hypothetical protein